MATDHIDRSWALFEPYAFGDGEPGSMDSRQWQATMAYMARTHGLSVFPLDQTVDQSSWRTHRFWNIR